MRAAASAGARPATKQATVTMASVPASAGHPRIDPTGTNDILTGPVYFFSLASRRYTGGGIVDIGTVRIWSHSRQGW